MITDYFLLLVLMLLMVPSQSRRLGKSSKAEKTEESELPQDLTDETETQQANQDRELNPCLETLVVYSDPNDNFFDPDLMQLVMLDSSICFDKDLTMCTSPEGNTEYANAVCHIIDPCFGEQGCLSYALCNQVVTEETRGVVMTGSGMAKFDLNGPEDRPVTGTSEFLFILPDVAGKVQSDFQDDIVTHTVCYTYFA